MSEPLLIAIGENQLSILPRMSNRHGLIAGATGTGKTITLQKMAESFSNIGVPVVLADVKGDLSGICQAGGGNQKVTDRLTQLGLNGLAYSESPVVFWDVFGDAGHPLRATISEMGPVLLTRLLDLNDVQAGVLNIVFRVADDHGLLLLDLKDLRAMLQNIGDNAKEFTTEYGIVSAASIGAIQRALLVIEAQGGDRFFGEPALDLHDLMRTTASGKGIVNILSANRLIDSPKLYATFLLWLLSELFENLPETGDLEQPKLLFFFDEAHLLFDEAPKALLDKIEQVVRLIRSKGVGIYFVTQNPLDVPDIVLGQLGNRVQHALRAYTPRDQKAVKAAAETFRANEKLDVEKAIQELGVGEALVSFLDDKGIPGIVERALVVPPLSHIGAIDDPKRKSVIQASPLFGRYENVVDRESAYELLKEKATAAATAASASTQTAAPIPRASESSSGAVGIVGSFAANAVKAFGTAAGRQLGQQLLRGLLGGLMGGSSRRRR